MELCNYVLSMHLDTTAITIMSLIRPFDGPQGLWISLLFVSTTTTIILKAGKYISLEFANISEHVVKSDDVRGYPSLPRRCYKQRLINPTNIKDSSDFQGYFVQTFFNPRKSVDPPWIPGLWSTQIYRPRHNLKDSRDIQAFLIQDSFNSDEVLDCPWRPGFCCNQFGKCLLH